MSEFSDTDILRLVAAGALFVGGVVLVVVLVRRHDIRWSGNAGIALGVAIILPSPSLGWLRSARDVRWGLPFLVLGILALYRGILRKRGEKHSKYPLSHCQHCDYDLTGNVSGRCPECGTEIPAPWG